MTASAVESRGYDPSRRADLVGLMARVWQDPEAGEHIEWWFDQSPVAPGTIRLAEVGGELAGTLGMTYVPMLVRGERTVVAMPVRGVSLEQFRGLGIFSRLELENEEESLRRGVRLALTIPNPRSHSIFLRVGWRPLAVERVWVRPLRLRSRPAATPAGGRFRGVERLDRFGPATEAAWREAAPAYGDHVAGETPYLNWRYVDAPHDYRRFAAADGFAVVRRMRERGLDTGMVCAVVAKRRRTVRRLLRACAAEMRGAQLLAALRPPVHAGAYAAAGFLPTPRTMTILGKSLDGTTPLPERPVHQFGDHDFV